MLIRMMPFQRMLRYFASGAQDGFEIRMQKRAVEAARESCEAFIVSIMEDAMSMCAHDSRRTVMTKDLLRVLEIRKIQMEGDPIGPKPERTPKKSSKKKGEKRHSGKNPGDIMYNITDPAIKRLCNRAGIMYIQAKICNYVRLIARGYICKMMQNIVQLVLFSRRKTVTTNDVLGSVSSMGFTLYPCSK